MKFKSAVLAIAATAFVSQAHARDQIEIVGSSTVFPFAFCDGWRKTDTDESVSSNRSSLSFGMSDQTRYLPAANQAGPSHQRPPVQSRSTCAFAMTRLANSGWMISTPVPSVTPNMSGRSTRCCLPQECRRLRLGRQRLISRCGLRDDALPLRCT